jgi:hypothetical protein
LFHLSELTPFIQRIQQPDLTYAPNEESPRSRKARTYPPVQVSRSSLSKIASKGQRRRSPGMSYSVEHRSLPETGKSKTIVGKVGMAKLNEA